MLYVDRRILREKFNDASETGCKYVVEKTEVRRKKERERDDEHGIDDGL